MEARRFESLWGQWRGVHGPMREAVLCCDLLAFYRKLQNGRPCLFPPVLFLSLISHFFALPFLRAASTTTLDIMTGSPPDMSTLNIAPQRLHDSYDYEGNSPAGRQPYHFAIILQSHLHSSAGKRSQMTCASTTLPRRGARRWTSLLRP